MNILRTLSFFILVFWGYGGFAQQLALGKSPFLMNKSAILELNADNQGFLLPRITDTTLINALTPPDGMVIFFAPAKQLMLRSNGSWKALAPAGNYITGLSSDVTATGPGSVPAVVSRIRGVAIPALSPGFLKYSGTTWVYDNSTYLASTAATLQLVTTNGNTSDAGIDLTQTTNSPINSFALKVRRANDKNPNGNLIRAMDNTGSTDLFTVDAYGNMATTGSVSAGTMTPTASLDVKGDVALRMGSFTAVGGVNNDVSVGKYASVRITGPTAAFSVTGITNGVDGRMVILYNSTDFDMTLTHDASSNPSNRIYCSDNASIVVKRKGCATLIYSSVDSRWFVVSTR